ncbi:MAG: hypothetical protein KAU62_01020, partial [Candidatus Heimdallarchaeota archaeon]|nr:hypothetical protein [Candidatus Heimdallarchaeota archaeon]
KDFIIYINDNFADNLTELIVEYSLNGTIYQPLGYPFTFSYPYLDGFYTLDIRAQDLAGNIGNYTISFIIDNTAPSITVIINELIDRIGYDGNFYIPPDSVIEVSIIDIDANVNVFYSWNGTWTNITGQSSFTLSSVDDGEAILLVRAYDSLSNEGEWFNITLAYDSTPPDLTQTFPTYNFRINDFSDLEFDIEDFTLKNIETVIYHWDEVVGLGDFDVKDIEPYDDGHFRLELGESGRILYSHFEYNLANLTIYTEDILGNNKTTIYHYEIDITPPNASLEYYDLTWIPMEENNDPAYEIAGGSAIRYDNSTAIDQLLIRIQWEINGELQGWEELDINLNPEFYLGVVDGNHTLIFEIHDDTGQGGTPNIKIATFNFYVDDMLIDFLSPINFEDDYHYKMDYNDTFTYQVNITDAVDNEPIPGLVYEVNKDIKLNLSIIVTNINITIYEITIHATNVTDYSETEIDVYFYRSGGGGQTIRVFLRVDKIIGVLNVLDTIDTQIMYEEDLVVLMYMENDIGQNQTIKDVFVNGTEIESFSFDNTTFICSFNYSSFNIESKGNFSLSIFTDSTFYNASTNTNTTINFEILPLPILITISVSNYTILEGTDVSINVLITYENGTPVEYAIFDLYIHVYLKNITETDTFSLHLAYEDANYTESFTDLETGRNGRYSMVFTLNSSMDHIIIEGSYEGQDTTDDASFVVEDPIITIPLPEAVKFPQWLLYLIIGGSIGVAAIISLIIYKVTRPKSFDELMERVTGEDIALNYSIMSPGVILTIFDQRKGPIPIVADHSLDIGRYIGRMRIGVENFLLKIADQAYSSLGFEEHDAGRRVGSIILPAEKMVAFVHGVQLENKMARGGFENLSLIVLADSEFGNLLLNYQEYLYGYVDDLSSALKSKKNLKVVEDIIVDIRKQSVIIMLAAQEMEKSQGGD